MQHFSQKKHTHPRTFSPTVHSTFLEKILESGKECPERILLHWLLIANILR